MVPIPAAVWERLKDSINELRNVDVALTIRSGVVVGAIFAEHIACQSAISPAKDGGSLPSRRPENS